MQDLIAQLEAAPAGSRELDYRIKGWLEFDDYWRLRVAADWTTSLDAALALAERVLPGMRARIDMDARRRAFLFPDDGYTVGSDPTRWVSYADAPTAPLALCIAILKAKAAA